MSHVHALRDGAVGIIRLDRAERFNSLDVATARDLRQAGLRMARDPEVHAVLLQGRPGVFCSGADLKYVRGEGDTGDLGYLVPPQDGYGARFKQILEYLHSAISELRRAPKPVLAAVDGVAAAGGFGLAMACDLVFASPRASFEWAYGRTGLTGAESSTFLLPRLLGLRQALDLVFRNPRLDAQAARQAGLVNEVFPADRFDAEVTRVARELAAGPTRAYAMAKTLMNRAAGMERLDAHLDRELCELVEAAEGAEFAESLEAFFETRSRASGGSR
jgi:2-(1,2-epoxy-1,2-dihydrophenyl)acetyl-CoA isomerase